VSTLQLQKEENALLAELSQACEQLLNGDAATSKAAVVSVRKLVQNDRIERSWPFVQQVVDTPGVLDKLVQLLRDSPDTQVQVGSLFLHSSSSALSIRSC